MSIVRPENVAPCVCFNVYAVKDGSMQTMESGATCFIDIVKFRNKYGSDKYAFEIERHGPAGTPKTAYDLPWHRPVDVIPEAARHACGRPSK